MYGSIGRRIAKLEKVLLPKKDGMENGKYIMTKTKGKRVTMAMLDAQFEILEEIARRRGIGRLRMLFEVVQSYTWAWMQERGKELRKRTGGL